MAFRENKYKVEVNGENYKEIEKKYDIELHPIFIEIQKYEMEIMLLKREINKLQEKVVDIPSETKLNENKTQMLENLLIEISKEDMH